MHTMTLPPELQLTILDLSRQMRIPELEVLRQAVNEYAEHIKKKQRLMSFCGLLTDEEADDLLQTIHDNRVNKTMEREA